METPRETLMRGAAGYQSPSKPVTVGVCAYGSRRTYAFIHIFLTRDKHNYVTAFSPNSRGKTSSTRILYPVTETLTHWHLSAACVFLTHQSKSELPPASAAHHLKANIQRTPYCETHYSQITRLPTESSNINTHRDMYSASTSTHICTCKHTEQAVGCLTTCVVSSITILIGIHLSDVSIHHRNI